MSTTMHVVFPFALTIILSFNCFINAEDTSMATYIIQAVKPDQSLFSTLDFQDLESWYMSLLPTSMTSDDASQQRMLYIYQHVMKGFAAKLTAQEAKAMEEKEGVVSVILDVSYDLHTTHSPKFLGLNQNLGFWKDSNFGRGVIIGVVDTGIKYDHPSFSDHEIPSPPARWRGFCEFTGKSTCNNKLIGARNLANHFQEVKEDLSDDFHHGTHTSGTAAGTFVSGANVFGNAQGTAVGMAPLAHIAMYKICFVHLQSCPSSAMLAAFDIAIEDGVDILSISFGSDESVPFYLDVMALGAFTATQKGILVSCSAGNSGPKYGTSENNAPWILSVGASTIDRSIRATVKLGNGGEYDGESIFQFQPKDFNPILRPLVFPGENSVDDSVAFCAPRSLTNIDVAGKVVLCIVGGDISIDDQGEEVKNAGGAAMVIANSELEGFSVIDATRILPSSSVSYDAGLNIRAYVKSTSTPTATIIFKGTVIGNALAPEVTYFSSRGPNLQSPGILKPDIIGPGVNILAAWPDSVDNSTDSKATFNIISGTSMSCPHLSGIAALIKSSHNDWSPAAVKSAIMTTADLKNLRGEHIVDQTHKTADLFATGAGHVNPSKANDPGLVYDIQPDDYIPYLCGLRYSDAKVSFIVQREVNCSEVKQIAEAQLNYPSFSILLENKTQGYTRTVTNVGPAKSTYNLALEVPVGLIVSVDPINLAFTEVNQKLSYYIEFMPNIKENRKNLTHTQGYVKWISDNHSVTSPISVTFM